MNHSMPGLPVHHQLLEFTQLTSIESVMPSSHLILCRPLLLLPPIPPSIRVFSNESALRMRWPKYWSFSFSIIPSKEIPGLISFRMDWLDLLAIQGTLKSLLQYHSSKASILRRSAFFTVQLSHPYMTTGKTIALSSWTFVGKVMSLLLNMLSRLVITFLPRSKRLLIPWLQSPSAVILEPKKNKVCHCHYSKFLNNAIERDWPRHQVKNGPSWASSNQHITALSLAFTVGLGQTQYPSQGGAGGSRRLHLWVLFKLWGWLWGFSLFCWVYTWK